MQYKPVLLLLVISIALSGCTAGENRSVAALGGAGCVSESEEDIYVRFPQLLVLAQKLDCASAAFYLGDRESSQASARELLQDIADVRAMSPDPAACDHLDYMDDRARCLLQRIDDDELQGQTRPNMVALIDSIARNTVVDEEIEIVYNQKTRYWIDYFKGSGRKHFSRWLERTGELEDVIEPILTDVGLPRDLMYLAVIESGLSMTAKSHMKAFGPWQFMSGTARLFGLRINWWIDERSDIVASTYAAANYLKYLHDLFDSWPLALAAYNAGEHRVAYAITRQRTTDYWRLDLPAQTMWFVPKFMAALAIGRSPETYGFERPSRSPLQFDIIEVEQPFNLGAIADAAGCSLSEIKSLNPHFKKWCTPPDMVVEVKVPRGAGEHCLSQLAEMKQQKLQSFVQHRVKKGETISHIAADYEVSAKEIMKVNEIDLARNIHPGNILLIPVKDTQRSARIASRPSYRSPKPPLDQASQPLLSAADGQSQIRYVVRKNDTLVKIAERFHTSLAQLREWNNLSYESNIHPGDTLWIRMKPADARDEKQASMEHGGSETPLAPNASADPESPASANDPQCVTHTVKKGETLTSIGRLYKVNVSSILAWNKRTNRNKLYPGEKLKIYIETDQRRASDAM
ncbi:MAG: LysM peptidoglycan-binding domain-containing protein [Candidatus Krumholzibacteria bacterium]|nr:LysM peptidoglycan-binding domain-containing protein [Candidatus Krumholzibacteria bacterium]